MHYVFSAVFWPVLFVTCILFFFVALLIFLLTFPFDRNGKILHLFSCFWAQFYFYCNPLWRLVVEYRERLPWKGSAVLVANHTSLGDILVLFGLYRPFKWVSKASVFRVPFLGWNMVLNRYIGLVRGDKLSIARMMKECERWLDRGVPILMFPEGTRSPDGQIKPFKNGSFRLAIEKKCPIIPIVLTGTADVLPKHGMVLTSRADCKIRILEPIDPKPFQENVTALQEHVRSIMIKEHTDLLLQKS